MEDYEAFMQEANATHTGWEFLNEDYIFQDIVASGWFYIMASFVTLAITAIFVGLRLYTRIWLTRFFGWDDIWCIATFITVVIHTSPCIDVIKRGSGRSADDFPYKHYHGPLIKYWLISHLSHMIGTWFLKITVLVLYLRTLSLTKRFFWTCYGLIFFVSAAHFSIFIFTMTMNRPFRAWWSVGVGFIRRDDGHELIVLALVIIITDIIIVVLPTRRLWRMSLPRRERIGVIIMLHAGVIATLLSVARLGVVVYDLFYLDTYGGWPWYWTPIVGQFEITVGLICACLPTLRAFFSKHLPGMFTANDTKQTRTRISNSNDKATFSQLKSLKGASSEAQGNASCTTEEIQLTSV